MRVPFNAGLRSTCASAFSDHSTLLPVRSPRSFHVLVMTYRLSPASTRSTASRISAACVGTM